MEGIALECDITVVLLLSLYVNKTGPFSDFEFDLSSFTVIELSAARYLA